MFRMQIKAILPIIKVSLYYPFSERDQIIIPARSVKINLTPVLDIALRAKLGGQVVVIFKKRNKKIHFILLFSKILGTNIEPS